MGGKTSTLRPEALMDLEDTIDFTENEIRAWYREFLRDSPDGHLTIAQFKDVYRQHFPNGDATRFAEHVFRTFDVEESDGEHLLDFREFMCAMNVTARAGPRQRLEWAFQMYDLDESGYITQEQCTEIIRATYRLSGGDSALNQGITPEERSKQIFNNMDRDRDGQLSEQEFIDGARMDSFLVHLLTHDQIRV